MKYYDRYSFFRENGEVKEVPFIEIPYEESDIIIEYDKDKHRFDVLSYKYYNDANYGWLIMQANPKYGSLEYLFPNKIELRIPYPLNSAIKRYEIGCSKWVDSNK